VGGVRSDRHFCNDHSARRIDDPNLTTIGRRAVRPLTRISMRISLACLALIGHQGEPAIVTNWTLCGARPTRMVETFFNDCVSITLTVLLP
jgi:hypothetical protein